MTEWADWVSQISGGISSRALAARIGHSHPTAQSWMRRPPTAEAVIVLARTFNASVVEGFQAAGWLTDTDVARLRRDLRQASELALLMELQRRAKTRALEAQGWVVHG